MLRQLWIWLLLISMVISVSCKSVKVDRPTSFSLGPARTLHWVDRTGREMPIQAPLYNYHFPDISPDGKRVVMTVEISGNRDVYILDLMDGTLQRMTFSQGNENQPIWSLDGRQIAYTSRNVLQGGESRIQMVSADGTGEMKILGSLSGKWLFPHSWEKNGDSIVVIETDPSMRNFNIGRLFVDGSQPYTPLLNGDYHEVQPQISPDGRWLAYCTDEAKERQVYVRPFPDVSAGKWQVSTITGNSPRWSPDGKELYYLTGTTKTEAIMVVKVETNPTFKAEQPKVLFVGDYVGSLPDEGIPYDVHPDGKRFLMMKQ